MEHHQTDHHVSENSGRPATSAQFEAHVVARDGADLRTGKAEDTGGLIKGYRMTSTDTNTNAGSSDAAMRVYVLPDDFVIDN